MIIKEKFYMANINLEIDIPISRLMKSSCWLPTRGWMSLDKDRKNSAPYYIRYNYTES